MNNDKYLPQERREEILKNKFEAYQDQIVAIELANMMLEKRLKESTYDKRNKLGKKEEEEIEATIKQNKRAIMASYEALRLIADMVVLDLIKE